MSYMFESIDKFLVVRRYGTITLKEVQDSVTNVAARAKALKQRLQYISYSDSSLQIPPTEVRIAVAKAASEILKHCVAMHMLAPGDEVMQSSTRTALRGTMMASGKATGHIFVHKSSQDLAAKLLQMGESKEDVGRVLVVLDRMFREKV